MNEYKPETYTLNNYTHAGNQRAKFDSTGYIPNQLTVAAAIAFFSGYVAMPVLTALLVPPQSTTAGILAVCGPLLSVVMLFSIVRHCSGSFRKSMLIIGFRRFPFRMLLPGLFIAVAIMLAGSGITLVWNLYAEYIGWDLGIPPTVEAALSDNIWNAAALLSTALFAAPVFEEVFFRKVICGNCLKFMPATWAMLTASLLFSALHLSLLQLPGLLFIGLVWQKLYMQSKTLWTSVILHFYNNLIAAGLLLLVRFSGITEI